MSLSHPNTPVSQQDLHDFYNKIKPYMGSYPSAIVSKFKKSDLYSTDERVVGQWTDGKPLYQKTVSATGFSGTSGNRLIEFSDVPYGKVVSMRAFLYEENGYESCNPLNMYSENNGNFYYRCVTYNDATTHKGNISLYWKDIQQDPTKFTFYFTIQYTKQSDTATSIGEDTDYSTDEKIIGSWIDGRPLYQKTYYSNTAPSGLASDTDYTLIPVADLPANIDFKTLMLDESASFIIWVSTDVRPVNTHDKSGTFYIQTITTSLGVVLTTSHATGVTGYAITLRYTKTTN